MSAPEDFAEFHDERLLSAHRRLATCMLALGRAERALRLIADGGYGDASVKARLALSAEAENPPTPEIASFWPGHRSGRAVLRPPTPEGGAGE